MAVTRGRAFLLYIGTGTADITGAAVITPNSASGWTLCAGCQERSMTINNEGIDATVVGADASTPTWATQIVGAKSVSIEAAFRFTNSAEERYLLDAAWASAGTVKALMVYPPDDTPATPAAAATDIYGSQIFGEFFINSMGSSGALSDTFNGSISLVSQGAVKLVHAV